MDKKINNDVFFYICVPVYNAGEFIEKCIQSVLSQDYNEYMLILVNDGSTDNSKVICELYESSDTRITVINCKNEGAFLARQRAINYARNSGSENRSEYIVFLDADDTLKTRALSTIAEYIMKNKADIIIYGIDRVRLNGNLIDRYLNKKEYCRLVSDKRELYRIVYYDESYNSLCRKASSLSLFSGEIKSYKRVSNGLDLLQSIDLYSKCSCAEFIEESLYNYALNSKSITQNVNAEAFIDAVDYVQSKVYQSLCNEKVSNCIDLEEFLHRQEYIIKKIIKMIAMLSENMEAKKRLFIKLMNAPYLKLIIKNGGKKNLCTKLLINKRYNSLFLIGKFLYARDRVMDKIKREIRKNHFIQIIF